MSDIESKPTGKQPGGRFLFPRWANYLLPVAAVAVVGGAFYVPTLFALGASPTTTAVGYAPEQPVHYSHALHPGKLGLDCRYCHNTVERTAFAALPPTQTCMNCHTNILPDDKELKKVRDSWASGKPIEWVKVHNLANYVYFNHAAHVNHGVGCIECHGRIDQMDVVAQAKPLSMGWCIDCHRDPRPHLRPADVAVTDMTWTRPTTGEEAKKFDQTITDEYFTKGAPHEIHDPAYMTSCYTCHR